MWFSGGEIILHARPVASLLQPRTIENPRARHGAREDRFVPGGLFAGRTQSAQKAIAARSRQWERSNALFMFPCRTSVPASTPRGLQEI